MGDDEAERRRELEGVAYDAHSTPAQRSAARHELELLARVPVDEIVETPLDDVEPGLDVKGEGSTTPPRPTTRGRRVAVAGVLVGVLALGVVGGAGLAVGLRGHSTTEAAATDGATSGASSSDHFPGLVQTQPTYDVTVDPAASSRLAAGDPSTTTESPPPGTLAMADALLASPAEKTDKYPFPTDKDPNSYVDSSTRLLATSGSGVNIFGAKKQGDPGYCLMESFGGAASAEGYSGFSTCVSSADFLAQGISVDDNGFQVTWKGGSVSIALTGGN